MRRIITVVLAGALVVSLASTSYAKPSWGGSCKGCHGGVSQPGRMEVSGEDGFLDLGVQLDGKVRGALRTFNVVPGNVVTLSMTVLNGADVYAAQLKRLGTGGQLNSQSNLLVWAEANGAGNVWTTQAGYFTKDDGANGGIPDNSPVVLTFDLFIDASTPQDVYDLEFAIAGKEGSLWYQDEHFYLNVVPEPATMALLGFGLVGLVVRRRNKNKK